MDLPAILERFDEERRQLAFPGVIRQACGTVVRHISRFGTGSMIAYSAHDPEELSQAIAHEIEHFRALGHSFEWKTYTHDRPAGLCELLRVAGFAVGPPETVLVADVTAVLNQLPEGAATFMLVHSVTHYKEVGGRWIAFTGSCSLSASGEI